MLLSPLQHFYNVNGVRKSGPGPLLRAEMARQPDLHLVFVSFAEPEYKLPAFVWQTRDWFNRWSLFV